MKATRQNVRKELIETFDLKPEIADGLINRHTDLLDTMPSGDEDNDKLSDYFVADKMIDLAYGDSQIPHTHVQGRIL